MKEYEILEAQNNHELLEQLRDYQANGWEPIGGPMYGGPNIQFTWFWAVSREAVARPEKPKKENKNWGEPDKYLQEKIALLSFKMMKSNYVNKFSEIASPYIEDENFIAFMGYELHKSEIEGVEHERRAEFENGRIDIALRLNTEKHLIFPCKL